MQQDELVDYMKFPEPELAPFLWLLGVLVLLAFGAVLLRRWFDARHRVGGRAAAPFDPAAVTAELRRLNPSVATVALARVDGDDGPPDVARTMSFLKRDGSLLTRKGRFLVGEEEGAAGERPRRRLRRRALVDLGFELLGVDHEVQGRVVSRGRLSRRQQRLMGVSSSRYYVLLPTLSLRRHDQREVVRHYLREPGGGDNATTSYLEMPAFLHRTQRRWDPSRPPGRIEETLTETERGQPPTASDADPSAAAAQELKRAGVEQVWATRLTESGGAEPMGNMAVLGLRGEKQRSGLFLRAEEQNAARDDDLAGGDQLLLGYAVDGLEKELVARVTRCRRGLLRIAIEAGPREQSGFPVEIIDLSIAGLSLAAAALLDYLLGAEAGEIPRDADGVHATLVDRMVVLDLYPRFRFPAAARKATPLVLAKFQLLARIARGDVEEGDDGSGLRLGVEFLYQPAAYETATGQPTVWRLLSGYQESDVMREIHQALERAGGMLQADRLAGDVAAPA